MAERPQQTANVYKRGLAGLNAYQGSADANIGCRMPARCIATPVPGNGQVPQPGRLETPHRFHRMKRSNRSENCVGDPLVQSPTLVCARELLISRQANTKGIDMIK